MTDDLMIQQGRNLYKYDTKKKLRFWRMELLDDKHRTVSGLVGGKETTTAWTTCVGKQGRSDVEQASFEVASGYDYNLKRTYFETPEEAEGGARFFEPMLAKKWSEMGWDKAVALVAKNRVSARSLQGTGVFGEAKLDGFCCIAQASGLTSREGQPIVAVPHIMEALAPFFHDFPDAVLHGELYTHDLHDEFEALSSILKKQNPDAEQLERAKIMQLHVYDYPSPDVQPLPYSERRELLQMDLGEFAGETIVIHPFYPLGSEEEMESLRQLVVERGYEGLQVKLDLSYEKGVRSKHNLKHKIFDDGEFKLLRVEAGKGNYSGHAKSAIFQVADDDPREFGAGIKGGLSEFNARLLEDCSGQQYARVTFFGRSATGIPMKATVDKWLGDGRGGL